MTVTINGNPPSALQQQELAQAFGLASSNSPALTGAPTTPTAPAGTNTTQIASTAFVKGEVDAAAATSATNTANALVGERGAVATLTNKTITSPVIDSGVITGVAYLNGSKVLTADGGLTFDGGSELALGGATGNPVIVLNSGATYSGAMIGRTAGMNAWAFGGESSIVGTSGNGLLSYVYGDNPAMWYTNGAEQMRLTSTGLGIGTSSPTYKLDVRGAGDQTIRVVANTGGTASLDLTSYGVYAWKLHSNTALSFAKDSSELLRLDASGNLLLGATAAAYATSGRTCFEVTGTSSAMVTLRAGTGSSSGYLFGGADALSLEAEPGRKIVINTIGVEPISIRTNQIERVHIDASGNLGLGVVPSAWYASYKTIQIGSIGSVSGTNSAAYIGQNWYQDAAGQNRYITTGIAASFGSDATGAHTWYKAPSGAAGDPISFTQAMTLDASGNLLVGKTSSGYTLDGVEMAGAGVVTVTRSSGTCIDLNRKSDGGVIDFYRSGSAIGSISITTTATAYNTSSDYRLKNITGPVTNAGAYIDSLNPVEGSWKADGSTFVGLIAHEVQEASRTQVATGVKDGEEMQAMDYSASELIANMIAELKSLRARVAVLETT